MVIGLIMLILLLLVYFSVSAAIIYHLIRYGPEKEKSILLVAIYVAVSFVLLVLTIMAFGKIEWSNLM